MLFSALPQPQGLYDPTNEADSCGVAMVADIQGRRSHAIVADGWSRWRTSTTAAPRAPRPNSGDGAGILIQLPVELLRDVVDFDLPAPHRRRLQHLRRGHLLPAPGSGSRAPRRRSGSSPSPRKKAWRSSAGVRCRSTPTAPTSAPPHWAACRYMSQLFVAAPATTAPPRRHRPGPPRLPPAQARRTDRGRGGLYFPSLSSRTIVYKGMLTTAQLPLFFPDLRDERCAARSRSCTAGSPPTPSRPGRWRTRSGSSPTTARSTPCAATATACAPARRCWPARRSPATSPALPDLHPEARTPRRSTRCSNCCTSAAASLPHAVLMMIPEAWENDTAMDPAERAFYQFHASLMEPWDGPACVTFTDGTWSARCSTATACGPAAGGAPPTTGVILASETGVLDVPPAQIVAKGRLQPGRMFLVDTAAGRIVPDDEIKDQLATEQPYGEWLHAGLLDLDDLPDRARRAAQPRVGGAPADLLRLHRGGAADPAHPDGGLRRRTARLDGHRHPDRGAVAAVPAALRLLRRIVRPGDQPAAGRDPRGDRHLDVARHGPGAEPARTRPRRPAGRSCCRGRCSTTTSSTRSSTSTTTANIPGCARTVLRGALRRRARRRRPRRRARRTAARGLRGDRRRLPAPW